LRGGLRILAAENEGGGGAELRGNAILGARRAISIKQWGVEDNRISHLAVMTDRGVDFYVLAGGKRMRSQQDTCPITQKRSRALYASRGVHMRDENGNSEKLEKGNARGMYQKDDTIRGLVTVCVGE